MKRIAILFSVMLVLSALVVGASTVRAEEPDYSYDMDLPADGSEDTNTVYKITRRDESSSGYISIEAYIDEREVYVDLENVEKVSIYFNETDVDVEKYLSWAGGDVDVIISSDGNTLDGEFHDVPDPDNVEVETSWSDYNYDDGVFSFTGLETSTTTLTLSYDGWLPAIWDMVMLVWVLSFVVFVVKLIYGAFSKITRDI